MKQHILSVIAVTILAAPAYADDGEDVQAVSIELPDAVAYSAQGNPSLLQVVPLISAERNDVLQVIDGMRTQLSNYDDLAISNGITQTANAFVNHWDLAVQTNLAAGSQHMEALISNLVNYNSDLIQDFLKPAPVWSEESLFAYPTYTDVVYIPPTGGFFAE